MDTMTTRTQDTPPHGAVGLANLAILEREELVSRAADMATPFANAVSTLGTHATVKEVRTSGMMAAVRVDTGFMGGDLASRAAHRARKLGVLNRALYGLYGGSLQISPLLVIELSEIQRIVETLGQALTECAADPTTWRRT